MKVEKKGMKNKHDEKRKADFDKLCVKRE